MSAIAQKAPPDPAETGFAQILLASEGRPIPQAAIARVVELAAGRSTKVRVLTIARVHGTAFGMPSPGLMPTKREWAEQREIVATTIRRLKRKGISADGHVIGTRNATKKILAEARETGCEAIVMAADPDRNPVVATMMWSQEAQRVRRKAKLPVFLVRE